MTKRLLELFKGTGSVGKVATDYGYEVVSLDFDAKTNPTILADITMWDYSVYPPDYFDIIWASPDCRVWSKLNYSRYSAYEIVDRIKNIGEPVIRAMNAIISYFNPRLYAIENPQGMLRFSSLMQNYPVFTVDYCSYAVFGYRKTTNIWSNSTFTPRTRCTLNCTSMRAGTKRHLQRVCHVAGTTLQMRYRVPPDLIREVLFTDMQK
jgi:hypothetical protein